MPKLLLRTMIRQQTFNNFISIIVLSPEPEPDFLKMLIYFQIQYFWLMFGATPVDGLSILTSAGGDGALPLPVVLAHVVGGSLAGVAGVTAVGDPGSVHVAGPAGGDLPVSRLSGESARHSCGENVIISAEKYTLSVHLHKIAFGNYSHRRPVNFIKCLGFIVTPVGFKMCSVYH